MQDERTKKLLEARKKLLKRMGYSETEIGLKDIKESLDKLVGLLASKKVIEKKVVKEKHLLDDTKKIVEKLDSLIESNKKEIKIKNLKDIPLTEEIRVTNFEELKKHIKRPIVRVKQTKVEFPKRQKVYVDNFPNQIPNKFEIEKDDWERPVRIYEEYDTFALEFLFERDGKTVSGKINRIKI